MIEGESLYWLYSTIPQVLAALVGILAAFTHFRIIRLHELLLQEAYIPNVSWGKYRLSSLAKDFNEALKDDKKEFSEKSLDNAIEFKNFSRIEEIFNALKEKYEEKKNNFKKRKEKSNSKNDKRYLEEEKNKLDKQKEILNHHKRYFKTKNKLINIRWITFITTFLAIITIAISLFGLASIVKTECYHFLNSKFIGIIGLTILTLIGSILIVYKGIMAKAVQEE